MSIHLKAWEIEYQFESGEINTTSEKGKLGKADTPKVATPKNFEAVSPRHIGSIKE